MLPKIPLIRAGAVSPIIKWAIDHNKPLEPLLSEADLGFVPLVDVDQLVPVRNVTQLLSLLAESEGPDIGCRIAFEADIDELGYVGRLALGSQTPRTALMAISEGLDKHCSHELINVRDTNSGIAIGEGWSIRLEPAIHHLVQQYTASLIYRLIVLTNRDEPLFARISMISHPDYGLSHLTRWFKIQPDPAENGYLLIEVLRDVADTPFARSSLRRIEASEKAVLDTIDLSFEFAIKTLMQLQMLDGKPSLDRMARAAGCSRRSLQRAFSELGTSFSDILDDARRQIAEEALAEPTSSLASLSSALGYSRQSTLSHSLKRWTSSDTAQKGSSRLRK
jgi:AraC-like DNA-binding protein